MSSGASFDSSFEAFREQGKSKRGLRLTEAICNVSHFLFRTRVQLRFGHLSRAPLKMISIHITPDLVACDYLARAADPWDADLPARVARKHQSLQVLRDAIDLRALIFVAMPDKANALLRIYRETETGSRELVVTGDTHQNDQSARSIHSLTMRARVLGFRFLLEDDCLQKLADEGHGAQSRKERGT